MGKFKIHLFILTMSTNVLIFWTSCLHQSMRNNSHVYAAVWMLAGSKSQKTTELYYFVFNHYHTKKLTLLQLVECVK